jgi:hypothetical protein
VLTLILFQSVKILVWVVFLPVLTVLLGVPVSLYIVGRKSRGGLVAFVGWIVAVRWGWLPAVDGPFGIYAFVFWPLTVTFGLWFAASFLIMGRAAWRRALLVNRLMTDYGMPASEIV